MAVEQATGPDEAPITQRQAHTEQPDQYDLRDIIAQEIMAEAAVWMAVAAFLTFFVTSAGTLLIWRQVRLTREAVEDTGKATNAMLRQNELMEAAQRPYVVVECGQTPTASNERGHVMATEFRYANLGGTPAQIIWEAHAIQVLEERNILPDPLVPGKRGRKVPSGEVVSPNGYTKFRAAGPIIHWDIEHSPLHMIMRGPDGFEDIFKSPTFFHGFVIYGDMEGRRYIRGFCFTYENGIFRLNHPSADHNYDHRYNPDGT